MTIISPSILSANFLELKKEIESFQSLKNIWFHLDIMDGHFVPNLTFGETVIKNLKNITKHKLDAHFMVTNPFDYLAWFKDCGIHNFTFHYESTPHQDRLLHLVKENYKSVGISLNPSTTHEIIPDYLLKEVDLILLMSVNPGFGGQKFIKGILEKVESLHKRRARLKAKFQIQIDGGVNNTNAKELVKSGADNLVAGSYIFSKGQTHYEKMVNSLRG